MSSIIAVIHETVVGQNNASELTHAVVLELGEFAADETGNQATASIIAQLCDQAVGVLNR